MHINNTVTRESGDCLGCWADSLYLLQDSNGNPYQWSTEATYTEGQQLTVEFVTATHHRGHVELEVCPETTLSDTCFAAHKLRFVQDLLFGAPADPNYPERGYMAPDGVGDRYTGLPASGQLFRMIFELPSGVSCPGGCTLRWHYITG